jgi:chromosome segregation ATPase
MSKVRELKATENNESRGNVQLSDLQHQCDNLEQERARAAQEVTQLKAKLAAAEAGREEAVRLAAEARQAQRRQEEQIEALVKKAGEPKTMAASPSKGLHLELRQLQEKEAHSQTQIAELERKLRQAQEEMGGLMRAARESRSQAAAEEAEAEKSNSTVLREQLLAERNIAAGLREQVGEMRKELLAGQEARVAQAGRTEARETGLDREKEVERLVGEVGRLNALVRGKDQTIATLTMRLSEKHTSSGPEGLDKLDSGFASLAARQDRLDSDMELMEENLVLQATVAERDQEIAQLRKRISTLGGRKPSVNEILFQ